METQLNLPEGVVPMPAEQREELKRLAQAATIGPWRPVVMPHAKPGEAFAVVSDEAGHAVCNSWNSYDACFQSAVSPDVALATLRYIEHLEALVANYQRREKRGGETWLVTKQFITEQGEELNEARARLSTVEAANAELKQELADQEREKLSLVREGKGYQLAIRCYLKAPQGIGPMDFLSQLVEIMADNSDEGTAPAPAAPLLEEAVPAAAQMIETWVPVSWRLPTGRVKVRTAEGYEALVVVHETDQGQRYVTCVEWDNPNFSFGLVVGKVVEWCEEVPAAALPTTGEGAEPSPFVFEGHPNAAQQQAIKQAEPQVGTIWQHRKAAFEQVIVCESTRWDSVAFRRHADFPFRPLRYKKTNHFLREYEPAPTTGEGKEAQNG